MYDIYGKAKITGNYGDRRSYYKPGKFHEGDDIALPLNSPINAVSAGTVKKIGFDKNGYGNYIDIDHGNRLTTRYAHANGFNVKVGDKISEGQPIGLVGSTGRSSGAHLHFETIKDGKKVNPKDIKNYFIATDTIKPKGITIMANEGNVTGAAADINDLQQQIAQNQVRQRLQLTPEEQALKGLTIKSIMDKLEKPVNPPRYLTIQDLFKKNLDDTNIVPSFNPEAIRGLNDLFGTKVYNPRSGKVEDLGEDYPRRIEAQMQGEKAKALEEEKMQNALNAGAYNSLNKLEAESAENDLRRDLALQNLEYYRQRDAENKKYRDAELKLAQEKFEWDKAHPKSDATFSNITTVRKEFNAIPAIKNYAEIKRQFNNVEAVKKKFENVNGKVKYNANDQTLITTFNKILDPTSVVRESEFARTAAGQGLIDKIQGAAEKMIKGGSGLSKEEREDVFNAIEAMYKAQEEEARRYGKFYSDLAIRYGINPEDITGGIGLDLNEPEKPRVSESEKQNDNTELINKLKNAGYSENDINEYLKIKGLI